MIYDSLGNVLDDTDKAFINSIDVEYGRINNEASYYFCRIPKHDTNGNIYTPKVVIPSADGTETPTNKKLSALAYAKQFNVPFCINAGLFTAGQNNDRPLGALVINGVDKSWYTGNNGTTCYLAEEGVIGENECYPLLIDADGKLSIADTDKRAEANTPASIIAAGYKYAVSGWGLIIQNGVSADLDTYELKHKGKYTRQVVGQFENGDYFTMSVMAKTGNLNSEIEKGCNYASIASFLIEKKGAIFAYGLDGGASTSVILGKRSVSPILKNTDGRALGTLLAWTKNDNVIGNNK